jgi:release factor glutamine methyltransferase
MMHKLLKKLTPVLQALLRWYLKKPRRYHYRDIRVIVRPGVFYPRFIFSTRLILDFLSEKDLEGRNVLEIGAGCGVISLFCASQGAVVTATDINPVAIENIKENSARNHIPLSVIHSDLFDRVDGSGFDLIIVTPPYYPKDPSDFSEMAWFCGKDFEYFVKLFKQLHDVYSPPCQVIMILSEDCDINRIGEIAARHGFEMTTRQKKKRMGEWSFILQVRDRAENKWLRLDPAFRSRIPIL